MTSPLARLAWPCLFVGMAASTAVSAEAPTYSKDIAPILWNNCAGCHRSGEVGPFPLLSYKDAAKRASLLAEETAGRRMPPWKPEPGFGNFHDARRLDDAQIELIAAWAEAGAPEGDPKDLPKPPTFPEGWQLGTPDLVLEMPESYTVPASGRDIQRCFVIPIPLDEDRNVAAVEFRPGNRRVVHHSILYLAPKGAAKAKDESDPGPGFASFGGPGVLVSGGLGGWAPGAMPRRLPEGYGRFLKAGSDLIMQVHYHPDGKPEADRSVVGVYFSKAPVKSYVAGLAVRSRDIDIPPGDTRYEVKAESAPLPAEYRAIGITPHMHNVGREMKVYAEVPGGKTINLVWIKDWDFNWQGQYQYVEPIVLPKGSVVKVEAYFDNSTGNPRNPSNPPQHVGWGEQTTDEMCLLALQVTADSVADLRKLQTLRGNGLGSILAGGSMGERPGAALKKALTGGGLRGGMAAGFPIPEAMKERLGRFDANKDGRISADEVEAMPEPVKQRVRQAIQARMGGSGGTP